MKIGVLGTGMVGETLATALVHQGHSTCMGSRSAGNEKAAAWAKKAGPDASHGSFADAADFGELIFVATHGGATLHAIHMAGVDNLRGKIVIDVTNPLDFSQGMPPRILKEYQDVSLGEQMQHALTGSHIVKALNTMNCQLMVDARQVNSGDHELFLCGDSTSAKAYVCKFLEENFNWESAHIRDLGGISLARTMEAIVPLWVVLYGHIGTGMFNYKIVR
ncbi:NADP oxidoreductase [Flaviaesturariibacter flavus]|uniref:NADP oxidoreductase n=1 Tax=Flaviaesturariibacter flavus TaxID=2502780 RepID=A0A4R1BNA3_9BACT|nr:NAD(P)-binding domain-containing protein [Flaviaesturariibacter flavus]TCJ18838.1 NADP oxidoreductase [Flaviaesturariibacter flavus]